MWISKATIGFLVAAARVFSPCHAAGIDAADLPVVKEVVLPDMSLRGAETKFQYGHFVLMMRGSNRMPGPSDMAVAVLDAAGRQVFSKNPGFDIPDLRMITVLDAACTKAGVLVVSACAWSSVGQAANVLMVYDIKAGALLRIIRVNPVICYHVVADQGDNIWCLGSDSYKRGVLREDYPLLRKYSLDGTLLGSYLPRSDFPNRGHFGPQGSEPFILSRNGSPQLLVGATGQIVGWYPGSGKVSMIAADGSSPTLQSVSFEATGIHTVALCPDGRMMALCPADQDLPAAADQGRSYVLRQLDPATGLWASKAPGLRFLSTHTLVGADESGLVFQDRLAGRFVWLRAP